MKRYVYKMKSTGAGSDKFGPCEICKKAADSIYTLTTHRIYFSPIKQAESLAYDRISFGNKSCLSALTR